MNPAARDNKYASDRASPDRQLSMAWAGPDQSDQSLRFQAYWAKPGEVFSENASVWIDYDWRSSATITGPSARVTAFGEKGCTDTGSTCL